MSSLYNFIRTLLKDHAVMVNTSCGCLPFAKTSRGAIYRDCALCYLSSDHCGYHNLPNQHEDRTKAAQFASMELIQMLCATKMMVNVVRQDPYHEGMQKIIFVMRHLRWGTKDWKVENAENKRARSETDDRRFEVWEAVNLWMQSTSSSE